MQAIIDKKYLSSFFSNLGYTFLAYFQGVIRIMKNPENCLFEICDLANTGIRKNLNTK